MKEKYQEKIKQWQGSQSINLDMVQRQEIFNHLRATVDPNYLVDLHCGGCVVKMFEMFINHG